MEHSEILTLMRVMAETGISKLELEKSGARLCLERQGQPAEGAPAPAAQPASMPAPLPVERPQAAPAAAPVPVLDLNQVLRITSPMVGVFYAAPSPDSPPYIKAGDSVRAGDTVCIVEAMKMMNEISSEHTGRVVEVCVENGQLVEFGQVLFTVAP